MKLDENLIDEIVVKAYCGAPTVSYDHRIIRNYLKKLDLVFKSGDSSQCTLVENKDFTSSSR